MPEHSYHISHFISAMAWLAVPIPHFRHLRRSSGIFIKGPREHMCTSVLCYTAHPTVRDAWGCGPCGAAAQMPLIPGTDNTCCRDAGGGMGRRYPLGGDQIGMAKAKVSLSCGLPSLPSGLSPVSPLTGVLMIRGRGLLLYAGLPRDGHGNVLHEAYRLQVVISSRMGVRLPVRTAHTADM